MPKKLHTRDLMEILKDHLDEDDYDRIENYTDLEQRILIGAAFSQLGEAITANAKDAAMTSFGNSRGPQSMGRIMVQYIPEQTQHVIDTKLFRSLYPREGHAGFYKERKVAESIRFTIGNPTPPKTQQPQLEQPTAEGPDWHPMNDEIDFNQ